VKVGITDTRFKLDAGDSDADEPEPQVSGCRVPSASHALADAPDLGRVLEESLHAGGELLRLPSRLP
jgi:hypothetical protein